MAKRTEGDGGVSRRGFLKSALVGLGSGAAGAPALVHLDDRVAGADVPIRLDEPARGSRALAAALGALAAAALPPVHAVPLLLVSFTGLVRLIHTSPSPWPTASAG